MENASTNDLVTRETGSAGLGISLMAAGLIALLVSGCGQSVGRTNGDAERNPYFQRAQKANEMRDYQAAVGFYQKALEADSQLARAHLELGLLYDEKLGDPIAAIYHYRKFLTLEPKSDKRQLVEDFIERAKLSLASNLPQSSVVDPADLARLQNEKIALMQENATLQARVAELEKGSATSPQLSVAAALPSRSASAEDVSAEIYKAHTHIVQKGDTLQSLALKYYGTRSAWDKIYQVNRNVLVSKDQLKIGQQLVIP
jgi:tetratricopeptide (TPR) repeat protein